MKYNYIDGKFSLKGFEATFTSLNPCTEEVIETFPETLPSTVNEAVAVARKALPSWRSLSRITRSEYFEKLANIVKIRSAEIAKVISLETGKSLNESLAEVNESLHMAQYTFSQGRESVGRVLASEIADKDVQVLRKPKGVVAVISPWNFPLAIGGFWTSAPALLEGNTVVLKPSEETPLVGNLIAELYNEAGFPPGVFNVVHGSGQVVGHALVHADVNHICFTGSAEVGKIIRRACADASNKSCSCEMGSKSAVIVFNDAPLDLAVKACLTSAFKLSGQRCVSAGRILVQRSIYDSNRFNQFVREFVEGTKKLTIGNPFDSPVPDFGPLINKSQFEKVKKYNEMTEGNAEVILHGRQLSNKGYFLSPHVYVSEWGNLPFLKEEVFGPHVAIVPFDTVEDAVRIYNDTEFGLSMAAITNNMHIARYMRDNCDFGLGYLNLPCVGAESHLPFAGVKGSGYGGGSAAGTFAAVTNELTWTANFNRDGFQMAQGLK